MVRAGIVNDPRERAWHGYHEIQNPPPRYAIVDRERLMSLVGIIDSDELISAQRGWVEDALSVGEFFRENRWTETIAVGSWRFVEGVGEKLGVWAAGKNGLHCIHCLPHFLFVVLPSSRGTEKVKGKRSQVQSSPFPPGRRQAYLSFVDLR
jgi:hypothetical protein